MLSVFDASAHFPNSGILSGNANHFGDFEECLSVISSDVGFQGKHCYVEMQPFIDESIYPYSEFIRQRIQSFDIIQSNLNDVRRKVGKILMIKS